MSTPVGESVLAKRVYKNCPIMLPNRVSYVDLVEIYMFDFDIIWVWIGCMHVLPPYIVGQES